MPTQPKLLSRTTRHTKVGNSPNSQAIRKAAWEFRPVSSGAPVSSGRQVPPGLRLQTTLVDGVFEGGGALGAAYIGALRALNDNNIWFARVVGNSAGAITAAMVAVGFTAPEIQWLSSGFTPRPQRPQSLTSCGIMDPIAFSDFLDLPTLATVSTNSMQKTLLWNALKGTILDEIGKKEIPIPTQADAVTDCMNGIMGNPILGPAIRAIPGTGAQQNMESVLNIALALLPNRQLLISDFLPIEASVPLRAALADTLWTAIAKKHPVLLMLTNLMHEGSIFEGNVFLEKISRLFSLKKFGPGNPTQKVRFSDLTIPLAVIAADIDRGRMDVYSNVKSPTLEVAEAVRRSMSVPFVFQPRASGDVVDGGLCSNFPLWLFTAGGQNLVTQLGNDAQRTKIGFVLQESLAAKAIWNVQPPRFAVAGQPPKVDDMTVVKPILVEKLRELNLPSFPEAGVENDLSELAVLKEISGMMGIDKEASTRDVITKGLMAGSTYFDVVIPLLGYHWLDFYVNEDEDDVFAMWDRAWNATRELVPLINPHSHMRVQQSPYKVS
jgi:predicted acylesterase/phospholipase RssA